MRPRVAPEGEAGSQTPRREPHPIVREARRSCPHQRLRWAEAGHGGVRCHHPDRAGCPGHHRTSAARHEGSAALRQGGRHLWVDFRARRWGSIRRRSSTGHRAHVDQGRSTGSAARLSGTALRTQAPRPRAQATFGDRRAARPCRSSRERRPVPDGDGQAHCFRNARRGPAHTRTRAQLRPRMPRSARAVPDWAPPGAISHNVVRRRCISGCAQRRAVLARPARYQWRCADQPRSISAAMLCANASGRERNGWCPALNSTSRAPDLTR